MELTTVILAMVMTLLMLTERNIADACQCGPLRHPQESFCRADYVIIGRIIERINEYDDFPEMPMMPNIPGDGLPVPAITEAPRREPVPISNIPILRKVQAPEEVMVFPPLIVNDGPHLNFPGYWERRGMLKYVVQVEKVFKGGERILISNKVVIQTDLSGSLCGLTHLNTNERYLITGSYDGDKMSLYLCDWVERTRDLTKTQRRGLRHFYEKYCDSCQIETGTFYFPGVPEGKRVCSYNHHPYSVTDCEAKFSSCIQRPSGTCRWYKGKDYQMCRKSTEYKRSQYQH